MRCLTLNTFSRRGESRANSVALSRQSTPTPSQMRDQDMDAAVLNRNAYDEHGPYDLDFSAGPSRPPPIPYDDPYADEYSPTAPQVTTHDSPHIRPKSFAHDGHHASGARDRGGSGYDQGEGRGRGRGRGRGWGRGDHGRGNFGASQRRSSTAGATGWNPPSMSAPPGAGAPYDPNIPRPLSPTSLAIARATGQMSNAFNYSSQQPIRSGGEAWGYQNPQFQAGQQYQFGAQGYPPPFVQPHINPRFASTFAINMGMTQAQQFTPYNPHMENYVNASLQNGSNWADEWTVSTGGPPPSNGSEK
jgi:H/ACA ribonucleoprotein complex non-core subunit NAF1